MTPTREDLELYAMGEYDGDPAALEAALDQDPEARAVLAGEAELELVLRDAAAAATFCPGCADLVQGSRCDACGAAIAPGGYRVERVLVSNAHGRMYVARDADGKQVALKELAFVQAPGLAVIAAFEREAKFLRALEHPAIPRFVASFEEGSGVHTRYYLAQELVSGRSLEARLDDHWFTETEIVDIARQVLEVLVYLQGLSPMVIHRDIKPANLVTRGDGTLAVVDFGAAHVQGTTIGSTSIGTFGYMPVEQLAGQVDATTDLYALGASLLHLLGRREPWRILQRLELDTINASRPVRDFLATLVAPDPRDRFENAAVALAALDRGTKGLPVISTASSNRGWLRPLLAAAAALLVVGSGVGGYLLTRGGPDESPNSQAIRCAPVDTACLATTMTTFADAMCACKDLACADDVNARRKAWAAEQLPHSSGQPQNPHIEALQAAEWARYAQCMAALDVAESPVGPPIPAGTLVDVSVDGAPLHDVLQSVSQQCGANVVIPDSIEGRVTVRLAKVPCDQALEVLLESRGLWYRYSPQGRMLRIAERERLDREREQARQRARQGWVADPLPPGPPLDLDFKNAPLHDLLRMLAQAAGVNIVIPDEIGGRVTVRLEAAPWDRTLETVLEAHGLWYRYRPGGKLLRIAERERLDREDEQARELPNR
jgi:hypothetical protein